MKEDFSQYFDPEYLSTFSNLQISTQLLLNGFMLGVHSSPMHGFSAEFSDRRPYVVGDAIKFIDWKVYGKTGKYFIKQFEDETNIYANIFIDITSSMGYKHENSNYSKLDYAKQLSAAFAHLLIGQKDAVGVGWYSDKLEEYIPQKSSKGHLKEIIKHIASLDTTDVAETYNAFNTLDSVLNRAGLCIIISDFLEDEKKLTEKILNLKNRNQDIIVFMIADDYEFNLDFDKNFYFIDSETGEKLEVQSTLIKDSYTNLYSKHVKNIEKVLHQRKINFVFTTTKTPFHKPLAEMILLRSKKF